jgi:hypothetical protein
MSAAIVFDKDATGPMCENRRWGIPHERVRLSRPRGRLKGVREIMVETCPVSAAVEDACLTLLPDFPGAERPIVPNVPETAGYRGFLFAATDL